MANIAVDTLLGLLARPDLPESSAAAGDARFSSALQAAVEREQPDETTESSGRSRASAGGRDQRDQDPAETPAPEAADDRERADAEGSRHVDESDSAEISAAAVAASEVPEATAVPANDDSAASQVVAEELAAATEAETTVKDDAQRDAAGQRSNSAETTSTLPASPGAGAPHEGASSVASDKVPDGASAETANQSQSSVPRPGSHLDATASSPDDQQLSTGTDGSPAADNVRAVPLEGSADDGGSASQATSPKATEQAAQERSPHAAASDQGEVAVSDLQVGVRQELAGDEDLESGERGRRSEGAMDVKASDAKAQATLERLASPRGSQLHASAPGNEASVEVDRPRFLQRVGGAIETAERRGGAIRVRLSPPELGSLRIELAVKQGTLTATLETETSAARQVLLDNLPALRARLAEQEIRVEQFDVDVRRDGRHSPDGGEDRQESETEPRRRGERTLSDSSPQAPARTAAPGVRADDGSAENLDIRI